MKIKQLLTILVLVTPLLVQVHLCHAQQKLGMFLPENQQKVTIPFRMINNLVVIPVTINNQITLNFIMDTGASNLILTDRIFGDLMDLHYDREIQISGPGLVDSVRAYVANQVSISLPNGITGQNLSMLVLEEDYIQLKKNLGEELYGIIGYDLFKQFVVEINYDQMEITLYNPSQFNARRSYTSYPLLIEQTKPYMYVHVSNGGKVEKLKLMIDTGASHALLLDLTASERLTEADTTLETTLGHGLGGEIPGRIGRYDNLRIGKFDLQDILVSFPYQGVYSNAIKRGSRHGTIGGNTLSHFNVIFNYPNSKIYLQRNGMFNAPFDFDMSGLRISFYENPNRLEVSAVLKNSPADLAGLRVGDVVESINGKSILNAHLSQIYTLLRSKDEKEIKVKIMRGEERMTKDFFLKKMI